MKKGTKIKTAFDEYTLIQQVGSGGNGRVFSAKSESEELVAIKFVERNISSSKLKRFKNEINFCEQHKHKNIVPIIDHGHAMVNDKEYVFYVMPLYNETLKSKIKSGIPHDKILDIFIGLLEGLQFAHGHGTIHRDVKPENIMFAQGSYEPIICDFGIAHFSEEDLLTVIETKVGERMANFQYSAPEQRTKGGNVCFQTDIYALSLILNEMFTGEIPQAADYKKIASVNSDYQYLDELFAQMFRQDPMDRLYPETKILSEMKFLAEQHRRKEEQQRIENTITTVVIPNDFKATIVHKSYYDGCLAFEFDKTLPVEWIHIIVHGTYSHTSTWGYDHTCLKRITSNVLGMPLHGDEDENLLKSIVANMNSWVSIVNRLYSQKLQERAKEEQQRVDEERKAEIKRIKQAATIDSILAKL